MQFSEEFVEAVVRKTREKLAQSRASATGVKQGIMNQKIALEGKRNKLEDALVDGTIDREAFKRKHTELQDKIANTETQLQDVDNRSKIDMDLIDETLAFTRDIYATYKDAPPFMKRHYLRFFYEKVMVKNKKIFVTVPTPIFATLRDNQQVILKKAMLPLKDLFCNHKLEYGITLSDLKIVFEGLGLAQPKPAFAQLFQ